MNVISETDLAMVSGEIAYSIWFKVFDFIWKPYRRNHYRLYTFSAIAMRP